MTEVNDQMNMFIISDNKSIINIYLFPICSLIIKCNNSIDNKLYQNDIDIAVETIKEIDRLVSDITGH